MLLILLLSVIALVAVLSLVYVLFPYALSVNSSSHVNRASSRESSSHHPHTRETARRQRQLARGIIRIN